MPIILNNRVMTTIIVNVIINYRIIFTIITTITYFLSGPTVPHWSVPSPGRCLLPDFLRIVDDDGRCCWMTAGRDCDSHRYFGLMMMIGCMHYHIRYHYCSYVCWMSVDCQLCDRWMLVVGPRKRTCWTSNTGKRWWWWWWWWLRYWWMGNLFGGVNIFVQLARVTFTCSCRDSSSKGDTSSWGIDFIRSYCSQDELHRATSPSHRSSHRYPCVEESVPLWIAWRTLRSEWRCQLIAVQPSILHVRMMMMKLCCWWKRMRNYWCNGWLQQWVN